MGVGENKGRQDMYDLGDFCSDVKTALATQDGEQARESIRKKLEKLLRIDGKPEDPSNRPAGPPGTDARTDGRTREALKHVIFSYFSPSLPS